MSKHDACENRIKMKTLKLNGNESNAFLIMIKMVELSKMCLASEKSGTNIIVIHVHRKPPQSNFGVVIPGKPQLKGAFISETEKGWIAGINCIDFRSYLQKAFNDTPEDLLSAMPVRQDAEPNV
jgi:hypothetical protein